jgi:hypothetical protein
MYPFLGKPPNSSFIGYTNIIQDFGILSTLTLTTPSTARVGDILIFLIINSFSGPTNIVSPPAGVDKYDEWYKGDSLPAPTTDGTVDGHITSFSKIFQSGDSSFEFTFSDGGGSNFFNTSAIGYCLCFRDCSTIYNSSYIGNLLPNSIPYHSSPITVNCGNVTSPFSGIQIIFVWVTLIEDSQDWTISTPSGFTQINQSQGTPLTQLIHAVFYKVNTSGNTLSNLTSTITRNSGIGTAAESYYTLSLKR